MAVNNINALVDLEGLEHLNNSDYVSKYYNAGLANQGQRWTNEVLLEYLTFNVNELLLERYNIQFENAYLVISQKNKNQLFSSDNLSFNIYEDPYLEASSVNLNDFYSIEAIDNKSIIMKKKISILVNLYLEVLKDIALDNQDDISSNNDSKYMEAKLWIPLDYNFEYVSDGINKTIIYGSNKSIYVYIEPEIKNNIRYNVPRANNRAKFGIIFVQQPQIYEKSNIYTFSFTAKSEEPNVVRGFVFPYVNEDHNWVINNTDTGISAKAENATNLNIILAYLYKSGNNIQFKILSGLNDYVITVDQLSSREVYIKRHNGKTFQITCYVPKLDKVLDDINNYNSQVKADIVDILKNSTIILMTKLAKLIKDDDEDVKKEYKDGIITTIWTYNPDNICDYNYISIENDSENHPFALDFSDITNFSNLINYTVANIEQVEPDNYLHSHLIFDQIIKQNKQEVTNNFAYAVLQNLNGSNYNSKYINNLNFSLRYVNNVVGKHGDVIDRVSNTTDNRYFKVPSDNEEYPNLVTDSVYRIIKNSRTLNYNEYLPNYNIPLFDMSEFLIKDSNVINRQNILSFGSNGKVYYSYIGTSFETTDKTVLHIGTGNNNINLGEYSLIDDINKNKFKKHDAISIDFPFTYINSTTDVKEDLSIHGDIYFDKVDWNVSKIGSNEIYTTQIIPKFKYIPNEKGQIYHDVQIDTMNTSLNKILNHITSKTIYNNSNYLYCNIILSNIISGINYYYKYNDLLFIDNLLKYLGLEDITFSSITSNTNNIIVDNDNIGRFMVSSNNILSDSTVITASSDTQISISFMNLQEVYVANPLDIIHINKNGVHSLIINEHQSHKIKSIWKLPYKITN